MHSRKSNAPPLLSLTLFLSLWAGCSKSTTQDAGTLGIEEPDGPAATTSTRVDDTSDSGGEGPSATGDSNNDPNKTEQASSGTNSNATTSTTSTDGAASQSDGEGGTQSTTTTSAQSGQTNEQGQLLCKGKVYACGDGVDNDSDGKVDLNDPECISPCDDTEATFATALPGQNKDCNSDCYFDSDSGAGNDGCGYNLKCDPLAPAASLGCNYDDGLSASACQPDIPQTCLDVCLPLVPNGCDCFGCCEVNRGTTTTHIYLGSGSSCNLENIEQCSKCTFIDACSNSCERAQCELCFGDETLADGCAESSCPEGVSSCKTSSDCSTGNFCLTGCCVFSPG